MLLRGLEDQRDAVAAAIAEQPAERRLTDRPLAEQNVPGVRANVRLRALTGEHRRIN